MSSMGSRTSVSRRKILLMGSGVLASSALAGALAGCGSSSSASPTAASQAAPAATSAPASSSSSTAPTKAAAATSAPAATAQPAAASSGPVTLRVAGGGTTTSWKQVWPELIKAYQVDHKNVSISLDPAAAGANYDQKLFAEIAAGTLPDVIYTTDNYAAPFKQNKITQDMLPYAKQTKFPIDDFNKTFLDLGMVGGTLQMLPVSGDVVILFINKKMVKDAGVEIPWTLDYKNTKLWTTDDFYKVCQQLTVDVNGKRGNQAGFDKKNINIYGAAMSIDWWAVYVPAIQSFGGQLVSADLTKSLMDSQAGVDAFTWLTKPVLDGYWTPYSFLSSFQNSPTNAFNGEKAAITATVRGAIPGIRPNIKDDWDVAHFYAGPDKRVTGMGTQGFAMSGTTKHASDTWSFLEFMYNEPGMKIITSSYGSTPVEKRFYNATWWKNLPPPPANNGVFTEAFDYGTLPPRLPFYTTGPFTKALTDGLQAIELGQSTPKEVVSNVSKQLQSWLDQNNKK